MRPLRPTALLLVLALAATTGCSARDWDRDRWWNRDRDWNDDRDRDDDCRRNRGRVNAKKWQRRVDDFRAQQFNSRDAFRNAKQGLLKDLENERNRACNWETREVDNLMDQVRARKW